MASFFSSTKQNITFDENEESYENLSMRMNRSKLLLSELTSESTGLFKPSTPSTLTRLQPKPQLYNLNQNQIMSPESATSHQSSIYAQFKLDTNKFIDEESNLIDLLNSYSNICAEHTQFLNDKIDRLKMNRQKQEALSITLNEQDDLDFEKNIWNLIYLLYLDEQKDKELMYDDEKENSSFDTEVGINEALLVERLMNTNPLLRRVKLIIDWLEKIAADSKNLKNVKLKIGEFQEKCTSWEHTLHQLKNMNNLGRKERVNFSGRDFVDELDPDAPIRQNKPLHDLDQEDEYKIMEYIYSFVRAGDLNSARDFCLKIGQSWRAATLEGFKFFNDNNYQDQDQFNKTNQKSKIFLNEGNLSRDIWKLMVYKLLKDEHFSPYEKATYGSLAGYVGPVLPVCRSYMDFLWAYFKALYNHIVDKEIRQKMSTLREFVNVPYDNDEDYFFIGLNRMSSQTSIPTIGQIFERIKVLVNNNSISSVATSNILDKSISGFGSSNNLTMSAQIINNLRTDANKPFSIILKYVIMAGIDGFKTGTNELMEYLKTMLTSNPKNGLLLRFSSHLALFYRSASLHIKDDTFLEINLSYVKYLIENSYKEIIAYYLSQLPSEIQIQYYSKFLQNITDSKERQLLLKLAKERNMNVQAITLNIVENLSKTTATCTEPPSVLNDHTGLSSTVFIGKTTDIFLFKTGQTLTDEDKTKINALDWIVYDTMQRFKLLEYANQTMRYFLLERQSFEAIKLLFAKIPHDTTTIILSQYNFNNSLLNQSSANIENYFQQVIDNLPINVANQIKEYLCFKEYIDAINIYNDWFEFFHKEKPIKPEAKFNLDSAQLIQQQSGLDQTNIFAERITYDYQIKQYEDLLSRWNSKAKIYCEKVKAKLYSLFKFPFGGWMSDIGIENESDSDSSCSTNVRSTSDSEMHMDEQDSDSIMAPNGNLESFSLKEKNDSQHRKFQMKQLKKVYLPSICFILIDMLSKMKMNKELIKVSDLIASEDYKLYRLFDPKQMKFFLNKMADASISLIDEDGDFLGYN